MPYTVGMTTTPALADHVSWRKVGQEAVLLDLDSSEYFTFNGTGCRLLELISASRNIEQIVAALCGEFEVSASAAGADVKRFLARLGRHGLLRHHS